MSRLLCAAAHFLTNFLGNLLDNLPGDFIADFLGYLNTDLLGDFLLHIDRVLGTHSFGEVLALFSWNMNRDILALFLWYFLTFCPGNRFLHFLRHLLAMLLMYLIKAHLLTPQPWHS